MRIGKRTAFFKAFASHISGNRRSGYAMDYYGRLEESVNEF
jgi:hypothetical protein